jgi:hypothetical protein
VLGETKMPDTNNQEDQGTDNTQNTNTNTNASSNGNGDQSIEKLVEARVAEALKDIKGKLDGAYSARDEANRKLAEAEQREKEANLKRMEEEGKHKEVLEMKLAEANAKLEVAERRITELTRDVEVREALSGLPFRNDKAAKIAYKEVVDGLVQDDKGIWKHKSGISIKDWVEAFSKDEDQSFLFKAKTNNGSGSSSSNSSTGSSNQPDSLFKMSQDDVLKMAAEGKLPKRK